ncbi:MAG TPA: FliA/WhiG family RNA polymerase sigma factor [Anaeromyxobacteraceae bacterium]|nr:FliA/WhiG family RNA polymerase sigma factor [Anaeromyxobacteraceae bacterium]
MHRAHARYTEVESDAALIARHSALIDRAARRLAARTAGALSPEDLWSAGALGLVDAARRFDATRDVRFETFAEHRIRGAMLDEMRRMDHLPRRLRAQAELVERTRGRLTQTLQREPSSEELAREVGLDLETLDAVTTLSQPHAGLVDLLESSASPADEQVERAELARALGKAIAGLPDRLQLILSLHYVEGLTYREIAKIIEVSEPRVCQLHGEAMAALRARLGGA